MGENIKRMSQNELTYIPILLWLDCLWLKYIDVKFQYGTKHAQRSLQRCLVVFGFTFWSQTQPSIVATSTWHLKAPILTAISRKWNAWLCLASHEKEKQGAISSHTVGKKILKMECPCNDHAPNLRPNISPTLPEVKPAWPTSLGLGIRPQDDAFIHYCFIIDIYWIL